MLPGTNSFSQEIMPRVNHENSSNDSAEGESECIGDIGSIYHEATLLPIEIWEKIIHYAIDMFPEARNYLRDVTLSEHCWQNSITQVVHIVQCIACYSTPSKR